MPASGPAAAAANASFTAWAVAGTLTTTARSVSEPSSTGTRTCRRSREAGRYGPAAAPVTAGAWLKKPVPAR
jgi:hypothetical protein